MTRLVELKGVSSQRFFVSPENVKSVRTCSLHEGYVEVTSYAKNSSPMIVVGEVETIKELLKFEENEE